LINALILLNLPLRLKDCCNSYHQPIKKVNVRVEKTKEMYNFDEILFISVIYLFVCYMIHPIS